MDVIYRLRSGTTYPLLLEGSAVARQYGFDRHNYIVIDHEGIVRYRSSGSIRRRFDDGAIRQAIGAALEDLDQALSAMETEDDPGVEGDGIGQGEVGGGEPIGEGDMGNMDQGMETEQEGMSAVLERMDSLPDVFGLEENFPNPFNPDTVIRFRLPHTERVQLRVFDSMGRWVVDLVTGTLAGGQYQIFWDGRDRLGRSVASGLYFYRLVAGKGAQTRKMLLLR